MKSSPWVAACVAVLHLPAVADKPPQVARGVAAAAMSGLCNGQEVVMFSCRVRTDKWVALCASPELSIASGYLQYRFGKPNALDFEFPLERDDSSRMRFSYSRYTRAHVTKITVSFEREGRTYTLFDDRDSEFGRAQRLQGVRVKRTDSITPDRPLVCEASTVNRLMTLEPILPCDENVGVGGCRH